MRQPLPSWIWTSQSRQLREQYVRFRRRFQLDALPEKAMIRVTAKSRYCLVVNGIDVAFGPSRSYPDRPCVDVHDVTECLQPGDNVVAALVYEPGYSHYSYIHCGVSGLWLSLEADGRQLFVSDSSWKASPDPSFSADVRPISIYGGGQEDRDLRLVEAWTDLRFDDDTWQSATVCGDGEDDESSQVQMQLAPFPNLTESVDAPEKIVILRGEYEANHDPHVELRHVFLSPSAEETEVSRDKSLRLPALSSGEAIIACCDFGSSRAGSARLRFQGATGGEKILIGYVEKVVDGRPVLSDPDTYCQVRMTDRAILAAGANDVEPFSPRGGRFLLVGIVGPCEEGLTLDVSFRSRCYPLELTQSVAPADDALRSIAEMCWRTLQACALDGMVDCPWREQAVWVGDSAITASIVAELCDDALPLRRMLELAAHGASVDGLLPGVVVCDSNSTVIPAYSFAWVEGLSNYLAATEDVAFVQQHWAVLKKMLARFQNDLDHDGLLLFQPAHRRFLDWAELPETDCSCLYNLRYLLALQLATTVASQIGESQDSARWRGWAGRLADSIRRGFARNGRWFDDLQATSRSQHIAAFLTLTDLAGGDEARRLLDEAVQRSMHEPPNDLVLMSPYMHHYLFEALEKQGRSGDILDMVKHRWGGWIDRGARTTWENWEVDFLDGSQCHAWSAHPLLFIARHGDHAAEFVSYQIAGLIGDTK